MRAREEVERLIKEKDLRSLLLKAGELHGHFCPMLSLGVKAGAYAMNELGGENPGMEEIIAIVETNNCFSDGIQFVTGCTFGNNALIYRDFGKTAVTLAKRSGDGIRISVKPGAFMDPETEDLFQKVVVRREGSREETEKLMKGFENAAFSLLDRDELFLCERVKIDIPEYAPIFESEVCEECGESVMSTRMVKKDGRKLCIPCAGGSYLELNGSGIVRYEDKTI
ncbi:MAG: FmdE family protein [Candidatus Thermoplasmatota archaeon]|nr:FmdE family protein [Candidatus Thermoplasmatota archaeon]